MKHELVWGRCIAVIDGEDCTGPMDVLKLCKRHWKRQQELHRQGKTLRFVDGYNYDTGLKMVSK